MELELLITINIIPNTNNNISTGPFYRAIFQKWRDILKRHYFRFQWYTNADDIQETSWGMVFPRQAPSLCLPPPPPPIHAQGTSPEHLHLILEGLGLLSGGLGYLEHFHGHITMPPPTKHSAK